ncbi:MAG: hypothetical protein ACREL7_07345 [Longimicrobiales bacterium]
MAFRLPSTIVPTLGGRIPHPPLRSLAPVSPAIFMVHGTDDTILTIRSTSRRIVRQLRAWNYAVTYREFDGPHTVLEDVTNSFDWIATPAK